MRAAFFLIIPALVSSCGAGSGASAPPTDIVVADAAKIAPWDAVKCGDDHYQNEKLERHPALMGLPPSALIAAYGAPSASEDFVAGEPVGTFYGAYGKQAGGVNAGKAMRVLTWTKKSCNFSVFFMGKDAKGRVVEAFEWAVGAEF